MFTYQYTWCLFVWASTYYGGNILEEDRTFILSSSLAPSPSLTSFPCLTSSSYFSLRRRYSSAVLAIRGVGVEPNSKDKSVVFLNVFLFHGRAWWKRITSWTCGSVTASRELPPAILPRYHMDRSLKLLSWKRYNTICVQYSKKRIFADQVWRSHPHAPFFCRILYIVKKGYSFPVTSRENDNLTLPGRELLNYSRTGRVWLVTSQPEPGKTLAFFTVYCVPVKGIECR